MTDHKLPAFLRDLLSRTMKFPKIISYIHLKEDDDGKLVAKAVADDASMLIETESVDQIDTEGAKVCLGNLSHLFQILSSSMVKSGCELILNKRERNGKELVCSMVFRPNSRTEFVYIPTDPFRASLSSPVKVQIDDWPVTLILDDDTVEEINEFKRIHSTIASGDDAIINVVYNDDIVMLEFGSAGSHNASLELDVEMESETNKNITVKVLAAHLIEALRQAKNDEGLIPVRLSTNALQIIAESPVASHMFTIMGRKVRED